MEAQTKGGMHMHTQAIRRGASPVGAVARGVLLAALFTAAAVIAFALVLSFARLSDGVIRAVNQVIKLVAIYLGVRAAVGTGDGQAAAARHAGGADLHGRGRDALRRADCPASIALCLRRRYPHGRGRRRINRHASRAKALNRASYDLFARICARFVGCVIRAYCAA